jgi:uncharacterized membrane protein
VEAEAEFGRIVAFSDGVFAIAATLLVFTIDTPENIGHGKNLADTLIHVRYQLLAYVISFGVVGWFWFIHHRLFGRLTHFDRNLMVLNLVFLGSVALLPFSTDLLGDFIGQWAADVSYAATLAIISTLSALMWGYAARGDLLRPDARAEVLADYRELFFVPLVFLASIPIAVVNSWAAIGFWLLILVAHPRGFRRLIRV